MGELRKMIGAVIHFHDWQKIHRSVLGMSQKGAREVRYYVGDYEECSGCPEARFVPNNAGLNAVGCTKIDGGTQWDATDEKKKTG